jgi:DNA-binding response OmpR family regulator
MSASEPSAARQYLADGTAEPAAPVATARLAFEVRLTQVFVACENPPALDTLVTIALCLSDAVSVEMRARVIEHVPPGAHESRSAGMQLLLLGPTGGQTTEQIATTLRETDSVPPPRISWSSISVLVVDDDDGYREAAASAVRDAGFEVLTARSGLEGLSMALQHQPSAIITDVTMPGMDGWQLLRVVRARPTLRRTPVIFLTELNSESERMRGYQLGVDDYLGKPFSSLELLARVERALERAHSLEEALGTGIRGDLAHVSLASLLGLAEMERRTGVLQLRRDDDRGTLYLRDGAVLRIELTESHDHLRGLERFFHLLDWDGGRFELVLTSVLIDDELSLPSTVVLLEHARQYDEGSRR